MLCEKCKKNNATFHYHENINGQEKNYTLCSECAAELENSGEINNDFFKSFGSFSSFEPSDLLRKLEYISAPMRRMPSLLGSLFTSDNASSTEIAEKVNEKTDVRRKIASLEAELKEVIMKENYERAGLIRDELKELRKNA